MPAGVMKINNMDVQEVYLLYCKLFYSALPLGKSVLVYQLSGLSDALRVSIFHQQLQKMWLHL